MVNKAELVDKPKQAEEHARRKEANVPSETADAAEIHQSLVNEYVDKGKFDIGQLKDKTGKNAVIVQDGNKTKYDADDLTLVSEKGVHTIERKVDGKVEEKLEFDTDKQKAKLLDKDGKLVIEINGAEHFAKYSLTEERALIQLAGNNIEEAKELNEKLQAELAAKGMKPLQQTIFVDANGDMAIFTKDPSQKNQDTGIIIHKTELGGARVVVNDGKPIKVGKFSPWHGGTTALVGEDGKPTPVTFDKGTFSVGKTSINVLSGNIITDSDQGLVRITSSGGKSIVERKDIKVSADKHGVIENKGSTPSLFRRFDTRQGFLDGLTAQGSHFHINRNSIKIVDSGERAVRIDRGGLVSVFDARGHERQIFGLTPGGLPKFVNVSDNKKINPNTGEQKQDASEESAVVVEQAEALIASAQNTNTAEGSDSKQGQLTDASVILSNAAQRATNKGDLATANFYKHIANDLLAANDKLAKGHA